jgi:hypothetical protein
VVLPLPLGTLLLLGVVVELSLRFVPLVEFEPDELLFLFEFEPDESLFLFEFEPDELLPLFEPDELLFRFEFEPDEVPLDLGVWVASPGDVVLPGVIALPLEPEPEDMVPFWLLLLPLGLVGPGLVGLLVLPGVVPPGVLPAPPLTCAFALFIANASNNAVLIIDIFFIKYMFIYLEVNKMYANGNIISFIFIITANLTLTPK